MDYRKAEELVAETLKTSPTPEQLDAVLEQFLASRENRYEKHGYWVHSLSHFTKDLWKLGRLDWIKRFNEVAFRGATELWDGNCSDRLISDFVGYATFDLNPADFHLTAEKMKWMRWNEYTEYARARIEHGCFESADDLQRFKLLWKLRNPKKAFIDYSNEGQNNLVTVDKLRAALQELQKLQPDISEFDGIEKRLLAARLAELEAEMVELPTKYPEPKSQDWNRPRLQKAIDMTKAALAGQP